MAPQGFELYIAAITAGDKSWNVIFDNSKIKRFVPDYLATIPFSEGIKRTIAGFEADASRCTVKDEGNDIVQRILDAWITRQF